MTGSNVARMNEQDSTNRATESMTGGEQSIRATKSQGWLVLFCVLYVRALRDCGRRPPWSGKSEAVADLVFVIDQQW